MNPDVATGFLLPAAACWLGSLYCLAWQRDRPRHRAITAILAAFIARGLASLVGAPHVYHAVNHLSGTPNLARLVINVAMIVWSALILTAVAHWSLRPDRARIVIRWCRLAVAVAVSASIVLWSTLSLPETSVGFSDEHAANNGAAAALMLVYHVIVAAALIAVALCGIQFARLTHLLPFRVAMLTTAVGAACYLAFAVHRAVAIAGARSGWHVGSWPLAHPLMTGIGTVLMMVGLTMPMVIGDLERLRVRGRARRLYRRLGPLWRDLQPFVSSTAVAHVDPGDIEYRVYRRKVDIHDALLALSHSFPEHAPGRSTDSAARVAQRVRHAVSAVAVGRPAHSAQHVDRSGLALEDRGAEEHWLSALADEYRKATDLRFPAQPRRRSDGDGGAERGI